MPCGTLPLLGDHVRIGPGDDWDWMWADASTLTRPASTTACSVLPAAADDDVDAACSPPRALATAATRATATSWPGRGSRPRRRAGRLRGAHARACPGVPHLASIATHPSVRGQGLGTALTAARHGAALRAGAPVVTLGMYADNDVARRMYARLGYVCSHRWSSRAVVVRPLTRPGVRLRAGEHGPGGRVRPLQ